MRRALLLLAASALAVGGFSAQSRQEAGGESGLFASTTVFEASVEAPFEELFMRGRRDTEYAVAGTLRVPSQNVQISNVRVSLRGHTSLRESECSFPKLRLDLPSDRPSVFKDIETLKIGTHCDDKPDGELTPKYGRWPNEKAPHREAAVYQLLSAMGIPTLRARAARLEYVFTDARHRAPLTRNAMLLEDDDRLMRRLGGSAEIDEKAFTSAKEAFDARDAARVAFAEAMVANFDWCLKFYPGDDYRCNARHPLYNVLAFKTSTGVVPAIYDLDLSGLVTGRHLWFDKLFNVDFSSTKSEQEVEVMSQLQRTRRLFSRADLDATRAEFLRNKAAAYTAIAQSPLDEGWRPAMETYLNHFFAIIESDDRFYRPAVVDPNARLYVDADRRTPACEGDRVPVGTIVSDPLETQGDMMRVVVLDAQWYWTSPRKCDIIRTDPVWIAANAVSRDYPK